jgi:adenylate cyclase
VDGSRTKDGWPIASILTLGVALLLLLALGAIFGASYLIARSNTTELVRDKAELVVGALENRIRSHLDPVYAQLGYLAEVLQQRHLDLGQQAELELLLLGSLAAVPQVSAVAFVTPELELLRAFRNRPDASVILSDWSDDIRFQDSMARTQRAASPYWGELFVAESSGTPLINLFWPVRFDDRFAGALIAGVSIYQLSEFLKSLEVQHLEHAFILYDRNTVLAHPALLERPLGIDDKHPLPALDELGDDVLASIWSAPREPQVAVHFTNAVSAEAFNLDGETFIVMYRELDGYSETPWLIGAYLSLDAVAPQLRRLSLLGWIGALVLAAGLILSLLFGQRLSRPIRELATAVRRIQSLDLEAPPLPRRTWFRELNEVVNAYVAMLDGLRLFAVYVPRSLVRRLMRLGHAVRSEEREVTILFTDLVGFTSFAEDRQAKDVAGFLNHHCRAAIAIAEKIRLASAELDSNGLLPIRMAIHTGRVVVGNIGTPGRLNYTIIGDAVNTTQRLEELARDLASYDDQVYALVSAETARHLGSSLQLTSLGRRLVRGRHDPLQIYCLDQAHVQSPMGEATNE